MKLKEITDLIVTQVRVFAPDTIPFRLIGAKSCTETLKSDFRVDEVQTNLFLPDRGSIVFERGEITKENNVVVINRIVIEPRRIILEVAGTSKEASRIYVLLLKSMESTTNIDLTKLKSPMILAETTQCIATLNFRFDSLLDDSFKKFMYDSVAKVASNKMARASVTPIATEFEITYDVEAQALIEHKISLSPKRFTIAPRANTPLEEKRYSTSSPFDSDTHLRLMQDLEKVITNRHAG